MAGMFNCRTLALRLWQTALATACLVLLAAPTQAAFVNVTWNPSPEPDIAGYVLFYWHRLWTLRDLCQCGQRNGVDRQCFEHDQHYVFSVLASTAAASRVTFRKNSVL
jgi:hypothetical protein